MSRTLASLFFYTRFLHSFSRIGVWRHQRGAPADEGAFAGQRWLVSGATGGIGRAIVLGAARRGATVLSLGRNAGQLAALQAEAPAGSVLPLRCDLSRVDDTLAALDRLEGSIDVLVNNVGVMRHDFQRSGEGVEISFATNLLVPFAMTERLLDTQRIRPDGLILSMSSGGLYGARLDVNALEAADAAAHDGFMAYAQHKRAQAELTAHWNQRPDGPRAYVMHPGWVDTDGVRSALPGFRRTLKRLLRSAEEGADIALWIAANRPPLRSAIWHDRHAHDLHAFGFTRDGATPAALVDAMRRRFEAIESRD